MQKQYRGTLKNAIQTAIFRQSENINKNKNKNTGNQQQALSENSKDVKSLTADEKKLLKLIENIAKASQKIGESLGLNDKQIKKFNSIYSFAQIQQIAFAERKGNANTCAVCSADNAHRMQQIKITELVEDNKDNIILSAKAQRLPAIPTRIVDGAVKKMATILAKNIVDDNWQNIKQVLSAKHQLHIPIITESNAFEFEPALADVKGKSLKDRRKKALERISPENIFKDKNNRIKEFAKGISAYSGANLTDGDFDGAKEELDHIIPRSHKKYGTLNDEANLICVTRDDNKNIFAIDTSKWFEIETPSDLRDIGVATIQYKIDNNSRPKVRVKLDYVIDDDSKINYFMNHSLLKSRYPDKVLEILKQSTIIEFESSGFNKTIKEMLGMTLAGIYNETSNN
ncbi:hypothetical protein DR81_1248 [Francisella tularensis]|nr:hypothetical protein DR81_1248 [Francisella tularensis]